MNPWTPSAPQAETLSRQAAALGDPDALSAKLQALEDTRTALQKRERALTLALDALASAAQTLTEAYGPGSPPRRGGT